MLAALHTCTFPGESSAYPLPPKAKSLFYEKTLLLPCAAFFNPSIETFLFLSFFLESAKFREITSKSSFLQGEQAFLQIDTSLDTIFLVNHLIPSLFSFAILYLRCLASHYVGCSASQLNINFLSTLTTSYSLNMYSRKMKTNS